MEKLIFSGAFLWLFSMIVLVALIDWKIVVMGFLFLVTALSTAIVLIWFLQRIDP